MDVNLYGILDTMIDIETNLIWYFQELYFEDFVTYVAITWVIVNFGTTLSSPSIVGRKIFSRAHANSQYEN